MFDFKDFLAMMAIEDAHEEMEREEEREREEARHREEVRQREEEEREAEERAKERHEEEQRERDWLQKEREQLEWEMRNASIYGYNEDEIKERMEDLERQEGDLDWKYGSDSSW